MVCAAFYNHQQSFLIYVAVKPQKIADYYYIISSNVGRLVRGQICGISDT